MRLYLSSFRLGNKPEKLLELIGSDNKKIAVIVNAADHKDGRAERLQAEFDDLKSINLIPEQVDLRDYFGKQNELETKIREFGAVWIRGGNVFVLKRAFEQSGFDRVIKKLVAEDALVYAGYSAGVCIVAPSLEGTEIVDDPVIVPVGYKPEFDWQGLSFIPYATSVHYKSDHPESADVDREVAYFEEHKIPFKTLRDGEVIVVKNNHEEVVK